MDKNVLLQKFHHKNRHLLVALFEVESAVVEAHYLARKAESNARTAFLGGVKRDENLVGVFFGDRHAVVLDADDYLVLRG